MKKLAFVFAGLMLCMAAGASAQAPAGAPAGATGICKDGTYSMQANKEGACRGHKGVQTWYAAAASPTKGAAPAAATTAQPASAAGKSPAPFTPAPAPASAPRASAAPAVQASTPVAATPTPGKRLSPSQAAAQKPQAPGGGPGLVWVNTDSNVYHCNGDTYYGKTKNGKYMTEADAKAAGARGERGKTCAAK